MTILLYKDGRLVIDDGNPIEGNSLEGLVACVSDPQSGDTLKFDGNQWVAGAAASGLPAVSGTDNGKVLTVVEGEWVPAAGGGGGGDMFIMHQIYQDGENRLDKTCAEIIDAIEAGKPCFVVAAEDSSDYKSLGCYAAVITAYYEGSAFSSLVVNNGSYTFTGVALDAYPTEDY